MGIFILFYLLCSRNVCYEYGQNQSNLSLCCCYWCLGAFVWCVCVFCFVRNLLVVCSSSGPRKSRSTCQCSTPSSGRSPRLQVSASPFVTSHRIASPSIILHRPASPCIAFESQRIIALHHAAPHRGFHRTEFALYRIASRSVAFALHCVA